MKLTKQQLQFLEEVLKTKGYQRRDGGIRNEDFYYYKVIEKTETLTLQILLRFYDFSKYQFYEPKEIPIGMEINIDITNNERDTVGLCLQGLGTSENNIFSDYNPDSQDNRYFIPRDISENEVIAYVDNIEELSKKYLDFYNSDIANYIVNDYRQP